MIRQLVVLVALCGLGGAAGATPTPDSPAPTRRIIGILDVEGPSADITAQFERGLEQHFDKEHYWLVTRVNMREHLRNSTKWTEGCLVGACLSEVKVQTGAELVLLAALTGTGTSFGYVVTVVRVDTGAVLSQAADRCEVCTINEATTAATTAAIRLISEVPDKLPDAPGHRMNAPSEDPAGRPDPKRLAARHARRVGLTLVIVGAIAAAAGVAVYVVQNHPDYGLATAAVGGGMAAGGVAILTF